MKYITVILLLTVGTMAILKFEPHPEQPGIIFENINNITFIESYRHLLFSVNISQSLIDMHHLSDSLKVIDMITENRINREQNRQISRFINISHYTTHINRRCYS